MSTTAYPMTSPRSWWRSTRPRAGRTHGRRCAPSPSRRRMRRPPPMTSSSWMRRTTPPGRTRSCSSSRFREAGGLSYREAYDDLLTTPWGLAVARSGNSVAAAVAVSSDNGPFDLAGGTVRDANQVTGHTYTVTVSGGNVTITDRTTGPHPCRQRRLRQPRRPVPGDPGDLAGQERRGGHQHHDHHHARDAEPFPLRGRHRRQPGEGDLRLRRHPDRHQRLAAGRRADFGPAARRRGDRRQRERGLLPVDPGHGAAELVGLDHDVSARRGHPRDGHAGSGRYAGRLEPRRRPLHGRRGRQGL